MDIKLGVEVIARNLLLESSFIFYWDVNEVYEFFDESVSPIYSRLARAPKSGGSLI